MSVYTELNKHEVIALLSHYDLGEYRNHTGISAGVENTNYFVSTHSQELVLTIFEKHSFDELPFFLALGEHLHDHHCAVPQPYRQNSGDFIFTIKGKPCVFFERVQGKHVEQTEPYITEVAIALANVHKVTSLFPEKRLHSHGIHWLEQTSKEILPSLPTADQQLLNIALTQLSQLPKNLPCGVIHADLFHDNTLFDGQHLTGIIDWYFAGIDSYALDMAIAMNDWCFDIDDGAFKRNCDLFLQAYQRIRPLSSEELNAVPSLQVQAATRFWLSRLIAQREHGASSDTITVKDPNAMKQLAARLLS
ncbi:homoserine kinase [Reinekea sp.]|jgi:homoserine kinase type II|uniref:homoserine kinase n=1 Tax=Reinekea sp. TaxID=1970455 RepID=UPI00398A3C4D